MGLVFALEPDLRRSQPEQLVLRSQKKRFTLGGTLLFIGGVLFTMYLAASPLFKMLWNEGTWFDKTLTGFFYVMLSSFIPAAIFCWFFEEVAIISKNPISNLYSIETCNKFFGFRWAIHKADGIQLNDLEAVNVRQSRNMAAIRAERQGKKDRYSTQGHWLLELKSSAQPLVVEKRAKKPEIDLLKAQIDAYFLGTESTLPS